LERISPLSTEEREEMAGITVIRRLDKGEHWIQEGRTTRMLAFVEEGYLRKYYLHDGKEITDYFYFENSFTGDLPAILSGRPSLANAVAMEPSTLLTLPYTALDGLCRQYHPIEHILRVVLEQVFLTFYYRSISFISSTPKERYAQLVAEHPQVIQRATQYHIASYLGITPQHLSRLRAPR